jgi:hypothetical protein
VKRPDRLESDITDGMWWTRDRKTGQLEVMKVTIGYLDGIPPIRKGRGVWKMSDSGYSGDSGWENLGADLLDHVEFSSRIPEPT